MGWWPEIETRNKMGGTEDQSIPPYDHVGLAPGLAKTISTVSYRANVYSLESMKAC